MDFIYPKNLRFNCKTCGICCGDTKKKKRTILMLDEEVAQINIRTGKKISDFVTICINKKPYSFEMKKKENGKCIFLSSENKCTIYSNRPLICRFYPFELNSKAKGTYEFLSTSECPGINQGKILEKKYFKDLFELAHAQFEKLQNP